MKTGEFRSEDGSIKDGVTCAFICPTCGQETNKIIEPKSENSDFGCRSCYHAALRVDHDGLGPNLHQNTMEAGQPKITVGKNDEIANRTIWHDGEVRDRRTGRPAQY